MRVLLISLAIAISFLASAQSKDQNYVMSRHLLEDKGAAIATVAYYNDLGDTYYIYNNLGQLRYALTPEYQKHPDLSAFAYQYEYDAHDNLVKKILPGAQYTQYWYDKDGRCVFSQDAGLRSKGLYHFYFYDRIGRLAVSGVCRHCKTNIGNREVSVYASQSGDLLHSGYKCNEADIIDSDGAIVENINDYDSYDFLSGSHKAELDSIAPKAEIQAVDSIDYLLGGNLVVKNGCIDKYLFGEGFCQAQIPSITWTKPHFFFSLDDKPITKEQEEKNKEMLETWNALYNARDVADEFSFYYYNKDHLGNNREVINNYGSIRQVVNYYPFGTPYCDATSSLYAGQQPYKYNSKEFDATHGLNTYDYGARQYNSILPSWDRLDPLCEKYYSISPYAYCHDNPVNTTDPDGMDDYFNENGEFIRRTEAGSSVFVLQNNQYVDISHIDFTNEMSTINAIGHHYISLYDKKDFSLKVSAISQSIPTGAAFSYDTHKDNYDLYLTNGYVNSSLSNCYDFECVAYHETSHRNHPEADKPLAEVQAIINTAQNCQAWGKASENYIRSQASYAAKQLNKIDIANSQVLLEKLNKAFARIAEFYIKNKRIEISQLIQDIDICGKK